jgi:p24 family protein delta-1
MFFVQGVELEIRKLEAAVKSIHHNLLYLKARQVIS